MEKDNFTYNKSIGIDLGIKKYAQLSDGTEYHLPRSISVLEKRKRKQQSRLDNMRKRRLITAKRTKTKFEEIPFTKNEAKLRNLNRKTFIRLINIKTSYIHQITTEIANLYPHRIVLEDLNITDMVHQLSNRDDIFHSLWYKFREILTYKAYNRGIDIVLADRNFASSQICSTCGNVRKQSNRNRMYICHKCGTRIDRDLNAAINLSRYNA